MHYNLSKLLAETPPLLALSYSDSTPATVDSRTLPIALVDNKFSSSALSRLLHREDVEKSDRDHPRSLEPTKLVHPYKKGGISSTRVPLDVV